MMYHRMASRGLRAAGRRSLETTALYSLHEELGGKMVPFAGYSLPVQYAGEKGGVMKEHEQCRTSAALFDVSHMGQLVWRGADRVRFLESVVVGDIAGLGAGEGRLSLITNAEGGIIDDTVITNAGDSVYMVVNGATKHGDMAHFRNHLSAFDGDADFEYLEDRQLLALQGPHAAAVLQRLLPSDVDLSRMAFMTGLDCAVAGLDCRVTRCGYTGEDGFEISVAHGDCGALARALLAEGEVEPAGLGARDSLRLEAGLCLYGNDIDGDTSPVEAALTWTIGGPKSRRRKEQGFLGAEKILSPEGKLLKTTRKRVGIAGMKAPARQGAEVYDASGEKRIGTITSGTFSPTLRRPVSMGYVAKVSKEEDYSKEGTEVMVSIRGKLQPAKVTAMPFVESNYYRGA